jgi:hypothetical protein
VRRLTYGTLDLFIVALLVGVLAIDLSGGGQLVIHLAGKPLRISARSPDNLLLLIAALVAVRYRFRLAAPFLGRWSLGSLAVRSEATVENVARWCARVTASRGARITLLLMLLAVLVKASLAWWNPGFFSGDDVEVQEMSLRALRHTTWPIWDLRNATFPLGFVYPAQRLAAAAGASDPSTLIWIGRCVVAVGSSAAIWLLWLIGSRLWPGERGWAVMACILFATNRLHIAFGSSELPRPMSTVLLLLAFLLLQRRGRPLAGISGAVAGVAACFRFSEAVFMGSAALQLIVRRRWWSAAVFTVAALGVMAGLLAAVDRLYWGEVFHSAGAAVDYTIVQRHSTRGYQSVSWYLVHAPEWVNPAVLLLAVAGTLLAFRASWPAALWAWPPLFVLSLLPHKEARYLIPVMPFVALLAVIGIRELHLRAFRLRGLHREWLPAAVVAGLALGVLFDAGHWRLPRTNSDVRLASSISTTAAPVLVVEQAWRLGGHIYLPRRDIVDVDPSTLPNAVHALPELRHGAWALFDATRPTYPATMSRLVELGYRICPPGQRSSYRVWVPAGSRCASAPSQ